MHTPADEIAFGGFATAKADALLEARLSPLSGGVYVRLEFTLQGLLGQRLI